MLRQIGHIAPNHTRRGPRLLLSFLMGVLMTIGVFALYGATREHATIVDIVKVDETMCRARLTNWLYGGSWVQRQEPQQWETFKRDMGECVR